jgi:hypothetical protein
MFQELMPAAMRGWEMHQSGHGDRTLADSLHAMQRVSVVAGRRERRTASQMAQTWDQVELLGQKQVALSIERIKAGLEGDSPEHEALGVQRNALAATIPESLERLSILLERRLH